MRKKVIFGVLTIFFLVALVSCNDASWDKLGGFMGGMGENVYGIKPNMKDVEAVSSTIASSLSTKKDDEGKDEVVINLNSASSIIQQLGEIGNYTQKLSQAKTDLAKPIAKNETEASEIKEALQRSIEDVVDSLSALEPEGSSIKNEQVKNAVADVKSALKTISSKMPENPTQGDLATVVIMNSLSEQVKELNEKYGKTEETANMIPLIDTAIQALGALKVTTEVYDIDVFGEFNFSSLLTSSEKKESAEEENSKLQTKDVAKADTSEEEYMKYVKQLQNSLIKLISQFAEKDDNGYYVFNQDKYQRFILQMTAVRTSYELASYGRLPSMGDTFIESAMKILESGSAENLFSNILKDKLSPNEFYPNDLAAYLISFVVTEMDKMGTGIFEVKKIETLFDNFLSVNEENLQKEPFEKLDFSAFSDAYNAKDSIEIEGDVFDDVFILIRTVFVIVYESGSNNVVSLFLPAGSTFEGYISENIQKLYNCIYGE